MVAFYNFDLGFPMIFGRLSMIAFHVFEFQSSVASESCILEDVPPF